MTWIQRLRRGHRDTVAGDAQSVEELRVAINEAAAAPDALTPRADFVTTLHRRLGAEIDEETSSQVAGEIDMPSSLRRRRVLLVAAGAAGAVTLGAAGEYAVEHVQGNDRGGGGLLAPESGRWTAVAAAGEIPAGSALSFSVANVVGVVTNDAGRLAAVSGVCTHQGCLLRLDAAQRRLDCPCHSTAFSLSGAVLHYALQVPPPPLPHLAVRERAGRVEVLLPLV